MINPDAFVLGIFGKMYKDFAGRNKISVIEVDFMTGIESPATLQCRKSCRIAREHQTFINRSLSRERSKSYAHRNKAFNYF
jgi:hypothetical protein